MSDNLKNEILKLKKSRDAIILAHYYQRDEVQEIADEVGDSYYLSKVGKECSEKTIVFCGVKFMAESAKILSPEKTVLLPARDAGCPMADMANVEGILELKAKHPYAKVVCYINSSAEVKAMSDVCCTSSNAVKIVKAIDEDEIIFLPDKNLGEYVQTFVPEKKIILWDGFCITHKKVRPEEIISTKASKPNIKVLVHPECEKPVRDLADFIGSTGGIIDYATKDSNKEFLIVTESGVLRKLQKNNPDKKFYFPNGSMNCVNMKKTTLEDVYDSLLNMQYSIEIDEKIRNGASKALNNMHALGR